MHKGNRTKYWLSQQVQGAVPLVKEILSSFFFLMFNYKSDGENEFYFFKIIGEKENSVNLITFLNTAGEKYSPSLPVTMSTKIRGIISGKI